jgi:hypothetical protein
MKYTNSRKNTSEQVNNSQRKTALEKREPRIRAFLTHVLGDGDGFSCIWTGRRNASDLEIPNATIRQRFYRYPDQLDTAIRCADYFAAEPDRELYFCVHRLTSESREKTAAGDVWTLYAEQDGGVLGDFAKEHATAIVESSPGRWHLYFRLSRPLPPEEAEHLNRRLAKTIGADPSGADISQVLRIPGTKNHKYPDKPQVKLKRLRDTSHEPEALAALLLPIPKEPPRPTREATTPIGIEDEELLQKARRARNGDEFRKLYDEAEHDGDRSAAVFALCKRLAFWTGWDEDRMETLLQASAWRDYEKLRRPKWVKLTIQKAIASTPEAYGQPAGVDSPLGEVVGDLRAQTSRMTWEGRTGPSDCAVYLALIDRLECYGTLKEKSAVVAADSRTLAVEAGVARATAESALQRLASDRKLIRRIRKPSGTKASVYALKLPAPRWSTEYTRYCGLTGSTIKTMRNPAPEKRKKYAKLRGGQRAPAPVGPEFLLRRQTGLAALLLEYVVAAGAEGMMPDELARATGRKKWNLVRERDEEDSNRRPGPVVRLLEAGLLVQDADERLRVPADYEERLRVELEESGCNDAKKRDAERYEREQAARRRPHQSDEAPTAEDLDREHRLRVEDVLVAWGRPRTGPAMAFKSYRDGETKSFAFVVRAVAHYYNKVDPGVWTRAVTEAYALATDGEAA